MNIATKPSTWDRRNSRTAWLVIMSLPPSGGPRFAGRPPGPLWPIRSGGGLAVKCATQRSGSPICEPDSPKDTESSRERTPRATKIPHASAARCTHTGRVCGVVEKPPHDLSCRGLLRVCDSAERYCAGDVRGEHPDRPRMDRRIQPGWIRGDDALPRPEHRVDHGDHRLECGHL